MTIIPESQLFDQRTMRLLIEHSDTVQRYRALFALLDWRVVPEPWPDPSRPGKRPHPQSAYIKALLIKLDLWLCLLHPTASLPGRASFARPGARLSASAQCGAALRL